MHFSSLISKRKNVRVVILATTILFLTFMPWVPMAPIAAHAVPGSSVTDPGNVWTTNGPSVANLQFKFYSDPTAELNDFLTGHLDLNDWPTSTSDYASFDQSPDVTQSPTQGAFDMSQFDFNNAGGMWTAWGCDFAHANSPCGIAIRMGFSHLFDRRTWITVGPLLGSGVALADPSPPAKGVSTSLSTQRSWELLDGNHRTIDGRNPNIASSEDFAFHIAETCSGGFCSSISAGPLNFCAAADEILYASTVIGAPIAAGRGLNCVLTGVSPAVFSNPIRMLVSSDDNVRLSMGQGMANAINQLFGGTVVSLIPGDTNVLRSALSAPPNGALDDWDMVTGYWTLPGPPFPDHLERFYSSLKASDQCGGVVNGQPENYGLVCIPGFDTQATATALAPDTATLNSDALAALNIFGSHVATIPAYNRGARWVTLRTMAGAVNQLGAGYPNFWSALNGHQCTVASSTCETSPINPIYTFGGGDPSTLRWGQRVGTAFLNPFNAATPIEVSILSEVYDTLFKMTPAPSTMTNLNWTAQRIPPAQTVDGSGNTHYFIQLCSCTFHDGLPVTSADVKFTLLNFRDTPAAAYYGYVESVISVNVVTTNLVEVVMQGQSISNLYNLARVPVIPEHIWDSGDNFYGQGVGKVDLAKTTLDYDPVASDTFIGSGPYVCRSIFPQDLGKVGTGCVTNADGSRGGQAIPAGGSMLLSAFSQYPTHPCLTPYPTISASPSSLTLRATNSPPGRGTVTITVTSVNGFGGKLTLSATVSPSSVPAGFTVLIAKIPPAKTTVTLTPTGPGASQTVPLNISAMRTTYQTTYVVTVTATGWLVPESKQVTVTVTP